MSAVGRIGKGSPKSHARNERRAAISRAVRNPPLGISQTDEYLLRALSNGDSSDWTGGMAALARMFKSRDGGR